MNGYVIEKASLDKSIGELRFHISQGFNTSDTGLKFMAFCRAQGIFKTLCILNLLTESQIINYSADLTELEDVI